MIKAAAAFKRFDAKPENYLLFREWWISYFSVCSDYDPQGQGILGWVLSPQEYAQLVGVNGPFVARINPGPRPILGAAPNAAAIGLHNDQVSIWDETTKDFKGEQKAVAQGRIDFIDNVPDSCCLPIRHPIHILRHLTIQEIFEHMDNTYLIMSPKDLSANLATLSIPYNPAESILDYIALHRKQATVQAANGSLISEPRRVALFIEGILSGCSIYNNRIEIYQIAEPRAADQTFEALAQAIIEYERNRSASTTSTAAGYAAAAQAHAPPAMQKQLDILTAEVAALKSALQSQFAGSQQQQLGAPAAPKGKQIRGGGHLGGRGPGGGGGGGGGPSGGGGGPHNGAGGGGGPGGRTIAYCWTHGACHHVSRICMMKKPGHQDSATFANQMGGTHA